MGILKFEEAKPYWGRLFENYAEKGYFNLSPNERLCINIRELIDAINNRGIISYYYSHGADNLADTLEDLETIDAADVVVLLEKVNALFPNGQPSEHIDERNGVIASWADGQYDDLLESLDDQFHEELEEVIEDKLEKILKKLVVM